MTVADANAGTVVQVRGGRLYLARRVHDECLGGCTSVALLVRDGGWWLLPLRAGAGGLQVKLRNAHGDRVVEAQEFLRSQGVEDEHTLELGLVAEPALGAFRLVRDSS